MPSSVSRHASWLSNAGDEYWMSQAAAPIYGIGALGNAPNSWDPYPTAVHFPPARTRKRLYTCCKMKHQLMAPHRRRSSTSATWEAERDMSAVRSLFVLVTCLHVSCHFVRTSAPQPRTISIEERHGKLARTRQVAGQKQEHRKDLLQVQCRTEVRVYAQLCKSHHFVR